MKTFDATARREGKWWVIEIPELGQTTQARTVAEIQVMATDLAAVIQKVAPSEVQVNISVDTPELPEATWREAREKPYVSGWSGTTVTEQVSSIA